jgi:hypothetical protein
MRKFEYKVKYSGTPDSEGEIVFESKFFAPSKQVAESLIKEISDSISRHGLITKSSPYQNLLKEF